MEPNEPIELPPVVGFFATLDRGRKSSIESLLAIENVRIGVKDHTLCANSQRNRACVVDSGNPHRIQEKSSLIPLCTSCIATGNASIEAFQRKLFTFGTVWSFQNLDCKLKFVKFSRASSNALIRYHVFIVYISDFTGSHRVYRHF